MGALIPLLLLRGGRGGGSMTGRGFLTSVGIAAFICFWAMSFGSWTVDRDWPTQDPCNKPEVCDTFAHYLVRHEWRTAKDWATHLW